MVVSVNLQKAKQLYDEYQKSCIEGFYGKRRRIGFETRVMNLARKLNQETEADQQALMYLDVIAARLGFYINIQTGDKEKGALC